MIRILFICHGNICRSPMAEFVMKDMVSRQGLDASFEIASAATSREEIGSCVHPGTRRKLAEHNIECNGKRARQVNLTDYSHYDYLICMDDWNIRNLGRIIGEDSQGKVSLLLDHVPSRSGRHEEVADPWYTGNFDETWDDINEGCRALLEELI